MPNVGPTSLAIEFNDKTHRISFYLKHDVHSLVLSPKLRDILAIRKRTGNSYVSETEVDVNWAGHTVFVYCDLVQNSIVGDVTAPLLRSTVVRGKYGENVHEVFHRPMYLPLRTNHFDTVRISIKSESGESVPFTFGNSCITLHFRRIVNQLPI